MADIRWFSRLFAAVALAAAAAGPCGAQTRPPAADRETRLVGSFVQLSELSVWGPVMAEYGVGFTWIAVPWNPVEPARGVFFWRRLDEAVQTAASLGFDLGMRVYCRSAWATETPPSGRPPLGADPSMPPRNPEDFANFVARLAQRYRGRVSRYSLENEAHLPANWPASPESYFSLLGVFQRSVRAGDPDALVEDGGFASDALGVLVAADMAAGGRRKDAADFAGRYFARFGPAPAGLSAFRTQKDAGLATLVGAAHARRLSRWASLFFANNRLYDAVQLHYFAPADLLPEVTSWVRDRLHAAGGAKPVEFWQAGHGWSDRKSYDEGLHAAEVVKGVVSALGEGALRVVDWQFTDAGAAAGIPGLFTARGPRPAAEAFRRTAGRLNGTTRAERLPSGKGIRAYRFIAPAGEVVAVWADRPCRVRLPGMSERVVVTDPSGNSMTVRSDAVPVSDVPVFVENVNEETLQTRAGVPRDAG